MKELINHRISGISIDTDYQHYLTFHTDKGDISYETYGDCCSESYFSEVLNLEYLTGQYTVTSVEEMPVLEGEGTRQDCDSIYGIRINMGFFYGIVTFRNSSNGFYGGDCILTDKVKAPMKRLTEDYRGD